MVITRHGWLYKNVKQSYHNTSYSCEAELFDRHCEHSKLNRLKLGFTDRHCENSHFNRLKLGFIDRHCENSKFKSFKKESMHRHCEHSKINDVHK